MDFFIRPSKKRQLWGVIALLAVGAAVILASGAVRLHERGDPRTAAGLVALAGLSLAWAVALLVPGAGGWGPVHRGTAAVAAAFLLAAAALLRPPWRMARPEIAVFYAVPALHALLEATAARLRLAEARPAILGAAAIALLAATRWLPDAGVRGLVGGMLFSAAAAVHGALLRPSSGPALAQRLFG